MKTICSECNKLKENVFNRRVLKNQTLLLCEQCYKRCLDTCSLCRRKKLIYTFSSQNKPICKKCYLEPPRKCQICDNLFPAGRGRICYDCACFNRLSKKLHILNLILSKYTNSLFEEFTWWLKKRKGIEYTSNFIQRYFRFFYHIDTLANELNRFPSYKHLLENFSVAQTRKYLLVMNFLKEYKIIHIDKKVKELYSNLNIINLYLNYFRKDSSEYKIINNYYEYLLKKYTLNKTTIRSIRLALTPAVKVLYYKGYFNDKELNDNIINGYLWIYPGQKSELTGFINFLNHQYKYELSSIKNINFILQRATSRKEHLKQRIINLLKKDVLSLFEKTRLINISIEYFHRIKVPRNIFLSNKNIFKIHGDYYINCCKNKFYLPELIFKKLVNKV